MTEMPESARAAVSMAHPPTKNSVPTCAPCTGASIHIRVWARTGSARSQTNVNNVTTRRTILDKTSGPHLQSAAITGTHGGARASEQQAHASGSLLLLSKRNVG